MIQPPNQNDILQQSKRILFVSVGIFMMCAALAWATILFQFVNTAASAQGVVTKLNAGGSHPQVRFTSPKGEVINYPQNGLIFGYQVGDEVRVLYQPQHPQEAIVDSFGAIWGFPILVGVMGVAFVGMALLQKHRLDDVS